MWKKAIKAIFHRMGYQIIANNHLEQHYTNSGQIIKPLGPWPQVCFMHIQKTAGTSLHQFFHGVFEKGNCFFANGPGQFDSLTQTDFLYFDFICGHFSYHQSLRFRKDKVLITFLRHPIDRIASMYWYCRTWKGPIDDHSGEIIKIARSHDFVDFLQLDHPQVRSITNNHQAYCFAADWRWRNNHNDAWIQDAALSVYDQFAFVGITERLEESLQLLCKQFSWPAPPLVPKVNVTPNRKPITELSQRERDLIMEMNPYDLALYEHARQRLESQIANNLPLPKPRANPNTPETNGPSLAKAA